MSRLLTRLTVGACLAAIPVFMPTSLHPGSVIPSDPSVAEHPLPVAPTHYVITQGSVVLSAAQTLQVKHSRSTLHATITTTPPILPGGLNGLTAVPTAALAAYQAGALRADALQSHCHLTWQLLAGIGEIESHHASTGGSESPTWNGIAKPAILGPTLNGSIGQAIRDSDHGRLDGNRTWDRAVGPMQFLPGTWASFGVDADHDGSADPQDIRDAAAAAGDYLCKGGVDLNDPSQLAEAIYSYNAADWYVSDVLTLAATYGNASVTATGSGAAIDTAIAFAYARLGDPYLWGGTGPLYDCSGLTQAAYAAAGINIPRTSEQQWLRLPHVADGQLQPGDLVFFNPGEFMSGLPGHVGIYLGNGYMINDPHTGAYVSIRSITGAGVYVGAARPALLAGGAAPGFAGGYGSGNGKQAAGSGGSRHHGGKPGGGTGGTGTGTTGGRHRTGGGGGSGTGGSGTGTGGSGTGGSGTGGSTPTPSPTASSTDLGRTHRGPGVSPSPSPSSPPPSS